MCISMPIYAHMFIFICVSLFKKNLTKLNQIGRHLVIAKKAKNNLSIYNPWFEEKVVSIRNKYFKVWPGKMPPLYKDIFRYYTLFGGKEIFSVWIHNGNLSSYTYNNSRSVGYQMSSRTKGLGWQLSFLVVSTKTQFKFPNAA